MQCANCNFFNMPGSDVCGRCGTSLRLNGSNIAVMPPRASPLKKRLRRILPVRRISAQVAEAAIASGIPRHAPQGSVLLFYLWSAVPGWPHFARRQYIRGHVFLWGFLIFLVLGLVLLGSTIGSICIGLAFSAHSSAIADLINQRFPEATVRTRMMRGLAVSAVLFIVVYWPIGMLISQVAAPYQLGVSLHPFEAGDVVLASTVRIPRAGDVVLYEVPDARGLLILHGGPRQRIVEGRNIDRVLAGPGATVECRNGVLFVNGVASKSQPLNPMTYPVMWTETVPPGHFFILPSDEADLLGNPAVLRTIGFVPQEAVLGRVFLRTQPWSRFSIIR